MSSVSYIFFVPVPGTSCGVLVKKDLGEFVADIIVEDTIILELKSVRQIIQAHEVQLVNYLVATEKPVGLIINFGERKVEIKRKVRDFDEDLVI